MQIDRSENNCFTEKKPIFLGPPNLDVVSLSTWLPVVSGTTHGTVLGFLLFLVFINDLPSQCSPQNESVIMLLADNTKKFQAIDGDEEQQAMGQKELQDRVDRIAQWARTWKMEINP